MYRTLAESVFAAAGVMCAVLLFANDSLWTTGGSFNDVKLFIRHHQ
jgi:hypothetical protein